MSSNRSDDRVDPSLFALEGFQNLVNGQYGYPFSHSSTNAGGNALAGSSANNGTGSAVKRRRADDAGGLTSSGYQPRSGSRSHNGHSPSTYPQTTQRNARQDNMTIQQTRPYHYDQTIRDSQSHDHERNHTNERENQATPKSDDDSDAESLEDHQLYETTGTPLPFPANTTVPPSLSLSSTYHSHHLNQSSTLDAPISSSSRTGKKPGRPALPPEIALGRKRDRARLHAAEARRRKKEEESGEGRWFRDLEIEKAVLEERYRRLERDHDDLKSQVAAIPCISMLSPHLAKTVGARPESTSNGTENPLLQIVLPLLLQTIDKGGDEVDVNALIGVLRGRNKELGGSSRKRKRTSEVRFGGMNLDGRVWDEGGGAGVDGGTSSDSAKSTPRPSRTRTRTKRRDEKEERSSRREEQQQGSPENGDAMGGGGIDFGVSADTPAPINVTPPPTRQMEPRTQMSLRKRVKTTSTTLPEPIPATPIDSDEDDGDFVPESELDDAGPTPYTDQAISPGTTNNNETPRLGEGEDEDDDDERFDYDPDDPDLYEPIVDVAVPDWLGTGGWLGQTSGVTPQQEVGQVTSAVVGNEERDELVARLRAEMGKSRTE